MPCKTLSSRLNFMLVTTDSTTEAFLPVGPWRATAGVSSARTRVELRQLSGNLLVTAGVQFANDPRNPDTTIHDIAIAGGATGFANANGVFEVASSVTTLNSAGFELMREGWVVKLSSGSTRAHGWVGAMLELFFD